MGGTHGTEQHVGTGDGFLHRILIVDIDEMEVVDDLFAMLATESTDGVARRGFKSNFRRGPGDKGDVTRNAAQRVGNEAAGYATGAEYECTEWSRHIIEVRLGFVERDRESRSLPRQAPLDAEGPGYQHRRGFLPVRSPLRHFSWNGSAADIRESFS